MNVINSLKESRMFNGLTEEQLESIKESGEIISVEQNVTLFEQNSEGNEVYILLSGRVQITVELAHKAEQAPVHTVVPGDLFGEFALITNNPRSARATAQQNSKLFMLARENFNKLAEENPEVGFVMVKNLSEILIERITKTTSELRSSLMF